MNDELLINHIKKILLSAPLDIYSEEEETVSQSSYELVEARHLDITEDDYEVEEEYSRVIGSVNLFIAASIVCDEVTQGKSLAKLTEEDLDNFNTYWRSIIDLLVGQRFMRETQQVAHGKLKLIVNNNELPNVGVQL
jgi:hypothetical protein